LRKAKARPGALEKDMGGEDAGLAAGTGRETGELAKKTRMKPATECVSRGVWAQGAVLGKTGILWGR